jgi:hypothetical protein
VPSREEQAPDQGEFLKADTFMSIPQGLNASSP